MIDDLAQPLEWFKSAALSRTAFDDATIERLFFTIEAPEDIDRAIEILQAYRPSIIRRIDHKLLHT